MKSKINTHKIKEHVNGLRVLVEAIENPAGFSKPIILKHIDEQIEVIFNDLQDEDENETSNPNRLPWEKVRECVAFTFAMKAKMYGWEKLDALREFMKEPNLSESEIINALNSVYDKESVEVNYETQKPFETLAEAIEAGEPPLVDKIIGEETDKQYFRLEN